MVVQDIVVSVKPYLAFIITADQMLQCIVFSLVNSVKILSYSPGICSSPLGLEDGRIRYGQLTSSSHRENNPADAGRINIIPNMWVIHVNMAVGVLLNLCCFIKEDNIRFSKAYRKWQNILLSVQSSYGAWMESLTYRCSAIFSGGPPGAHMGVRVGDAGQWTHEGLPH